MSETRAHVPQSESQAQFWIEGWWLNPTEPPVGYEDEANLTSGGWVGTGALKFNHPVLGDIWAVPRHFPMRIATPI